MDHNRAKWTFPELLKSVHRLWPAFNCPQSHNTNDSQHSSTYSIIPVVFRGRLTDAVLSRTRHFISQPASQTPAGLIIQKSDKLWPCHSKYKMWWWEFARVKVSRLFWIIWWIPVCFQKKLKIKIYRNIILTVVLYGCKTWSLTLRE